ERRRREEVRGIVEGGIDLLAGRETRLRRRDQVGGLLEGEQVRANRRGEYNLGHKRNPYPFWSVVPTIPPGSRPAGFACNFKNSVKCLLSLTEADRGRADVRMEL